MTKKLSTVLATLAMVFVPLLAGASEAELQQQLEALQLMVEQLQEEVKDLKQEKAAMEADPAGTTQDSAAGKKEAAPAEEMDAHAIGKEETAGEAKKVAGGVEPDDRWKFLNNIKLGADYRIRGAFREKGNQEGVEPEERKDDYAAYDQRLRVTADYVDDSGVALRTRLLLYDNNWLGDRRSSGSAGSDISSGEDNIALDYGFLEIPFKETYNFRIGRQEANWAWNFVTDDDRRDRMMLLKSFPDTAIGNVAALAIYDKRQEGLSDIRQDDGDMYALCTVTQTGDWVWGLLLDYWHGWADYVSPDPEGKNGYVLDDLWSFSPTVQGKLYGLDIRWALHYMNGNGRGDGKFEPGQGYWANDSWATFLMLGYDFDFMKVEAQGYYNKDGALVGAGWDSFSCVIQNSPRNDPNPIKLSGVGGLGYDGDDQWLVATRFSGRFLKKFGWSGSVGYVDTRNEDADPDNLGLDNLYDLKEYFFDLQGYYDFLNTLQLVGKIGYITGDEDEGDGPGAGRMGASVHLTWNY